MLNFIEKRREKNNITDSLLKLKHSYVLLLNKKGSLKFTKIERTKNKMYSNRVRSFYIYI